MELPREPDPALRRLKRAEADFGVVAVLLEGDADGAPKAAWPRPDSGRGRRPGPGLAGVSDKERLRVCEASSGRDGEAWTDEDTRCNSRSRLGVGGTGVSSFSTGPVE